MYRMNRYLYQDHQYSLIPFVTYSNNVSLISYIINRLHNVPRHSECLLLQGFPSNFNYINKVVSVNVLKEVLKKIFDVTAFKNFITRN